MNELTDESRNEILIATALLTAKTAESVAALIEATQPKLGQFGGSLERPTRRERERLDGIVQGPQPRTQAPPDHIVACLRQQLKRLAAERP